jgi:hypothetical protein
MGLPRTAWQKGQASPNPLGWQAQKQFADAIRMACSEEHKAKGMRKLRVIANQLVDKACEGDLTAIAMVGDRLDGKPISEHISRSPTIVDLSDAELLAIVAEAQAQRSDDSDGMIIENNVDPLP